MLAIPYIYRHYHRLLWNQWINATNLYYFLDLLQYLPLNMYLICGLLPHSKLHWQFPIFKHILTLSWPAGHICPTYKESLLVWWDNSIPLFLHATIYLEVSLFHWISQNAFFRETAVYKWYCVQCCMQRCTQYHLYTAVSSKKFILTDSTEQRYFNADGSMEKKWDTVIPADLKRLFVSGTYMLRWSGQGLNLS